MRRRPLLKALLLTLVLSLGMLVASYFAFVHALLPAVTTSLAERFNLEVSYAAADLGRHGLELTDLRIRSRDATPLAVTSPKFVVDVFSVSIKAAHVQMTKGRADIVLRGKVALAPKIKAHLEVSLPPTACADILAAIPPTFRPHLLDIELAGNIAADGLLVTNELRPGRTLFSVDLENDCRVVKYGSVPEPDSFRRPFRYTAYAANKQPYQRVTGPGSEDWTPIAAVSPYLVDAVVVAEDSLFWQHRGVLLSRIATALDIDIRERRARFGASTISMQLAKNLFLSRDKHFSRKVEELIFTWLLETRFSKNELLELYLNIAELGPSLYGVGAASRYYFGKQPSELTLGESAFLAKLLPRPLERHAEFVASGVSPDLNRRIELLLSRMRELGRITQAELTASKSEHLRFFSTKAPIVPPPLPELAHAPDASAVVTPPKAPFIMDSCMLCEQFLSDRDPFGQEVR